MTMPARLGRAALSGAIFFVVYWAAYAVWNGFDNVQVEWAALGAVIVAGLVLLRTYMVERLERRHANSARPTLRSTIEAINMIIRKPKP